MTRWRQWCYSPSPSETGRWWDGSRTMTRWVGDRPSRLRLVRAMSSHRRKRHLVRDKAAVSVENGLRRKRLRPGKLRQPRER